MQIIFSKLKPVFTLSMIMSVMFNLFVVYYASAEDLRRHADSIIHKEVIEQFYTENQNGYIWFKDGKPLNKTYELIDIVENSWTHGFNPENYHIDKISFIKKMSEKKKLEFDDYRIKLLDLYLSDAAISYLRDISGMRIDPSLINQRAEYWQQPQKPEILIKEIYENTNFIKLADKYTPHGKLYNNLREELVSLVNEVRNSSENADPASIKVSPDSDYIKPGTKDKSLPLIRRKLGLNHSDDYFYDDKTAGKVVRFQKQHNLTPDGIIDPNTLDILNRNDKDKILQLIVNMERLRWLNRELPKKYVLVNIASQKLWAIENGRVIHEMKVVVGKPYRRTKEFTAQITGVRFNPDWTIPPSIKRYDVWPKLKRDAGYLHEKGIELIKGYGNNEIRLDPQTIDWHNISIKELHDLRMVGIPGDNNPLGRVRILMPNRYNIYLHDTNHPEFFEQEIRTYSSGCVRVDKPKNLAHFILKENEGWKEDNIEKIISTSEKTEIEASRTIPVYLTYQTIYKSEKGRLVYGTDIYRRDQELAKILQEQNLIFFNDNKILSVKDSKVNRRDDYDNLNN